MSNVRALGVQTTACQLKPVMNAVEDWTEGLQCAPPICYRMQTVQETMTVKALTWISPAMSTPAVQWRMQARVQHTQTIADTPDVHRTFGPYKLWPRRWTDSEHGIALNCLGAVRASNLRSQTASTRLRPHQTTPEKTAVAVVGTPASRNCINGWAFQWRHVGHRAAICHARRPPGKAYNRSNKWRQCSA